MKKKIKEKFGNVPIEIYPMSGINLFYTGNGSIIVGYEK
jgi:fatty acid-binding protein DegV